MKFGERRMSMFIGEALAGDGNEIAHVDLLIGSKDGPVGAAFCPSPLDSKRRSHQLLAVLAPNVLVKPATVTITKVTIKGMKQAVQMFGPAQFAVAKAVADSVAEGVISKDQAENWVIVAGVFIHPAAEDNKRFTTTTTRPSMEAIANAVGQKPTIDEVLAQKDKVEHPFKGF